MRAISLREPGTLEPLDVAEPTAPGPGEVLVRTHRVGICGTDYHAFAGEQPFFSYPRVIGHELAVEVLTVGDGVEHVSPGATCTVKPYLECGECIACRRGRTNCCSDLKVMGVHVDGGMRDRFLVPGDKLFASEKLSLDQLVLVETLGIGAHAVNRADPQRDENVLIVGAGPIGLAVAQFCLVRGARVISLDLDQGRLDFCRETIGVHDTVRVGEGDLARIEELTDGDLPTVVFDATGSARAMERSYEFVAPSGKLCFVGIVTADISFHDPLFHRREMTVLGSRNAVPDEFREIIALIEQGKLDTSPWITHRTTLGTLVDDFQSLTKPDAGVIKAVVDVPD